MKTIKIDGKHYISARVVMLPTQNKTQIYKLLTEKLFYVDSDKVPILGKFQHVYLLSDSEIREGDFAYNFRDNTVDIFNSQLVNIGKGYSKIIATTNPGLKMSYGKFLTDGYSNEVDDLRKISQLSGQFLQEWTKNPQEEVLVEIEKSTYEDWIKTAEAQPEWKIKTSSDNTVYVKFKEDDERCLQRFLELHNVYTREAALNSKLYKHFLQGWNERKNSSKDYDWDILIEEYIDNNRYQSGHMGLLKFLKENFNLPTRKK